jgi:CDGSH-type Zn-finger protein
MSMVTVSKDGPYTITGGIDLIGDYIQFVEGFSKERDNIQFVEGFSKEHYTLCRCGASNNKPFCDGMHITINFKADDKN